MQCSTYIYIYYFLYKWDCTWGITEPNPIPLHSPDSFNLSSILSPSLSHLHFLSISPLSHAHTRIIFSIYHLSLLHIPLTAIISHLLSRSTPSHPSLTPRFSYVPAISAHSLPLQYLWPHYFSHLSTLFLSSLSLFSHIFISPLSRSHLSIPNLHPLSISHIFFSIYHFSLYHLYLPSIISLLSRSPRSPYQYELIF